MFGGLGKAIKTLFLCDNLNSQDIRRKIHQGLNVVENWNSANSFIFCGKGGEIATHNTLKLQNVLLNMNERLLLEGELLA
jgi:TnpA family transposase